MKIPLHSMTNSAEDKITSGAIFVGSSPTLIKFLPGRSLFQGREGSFGGGIWSFCDGGRGDDEDGMGSWLGKRIR
jgi:hypothetical protein